MVNKCCAPNCRSNYKISSEEKHVPIFDFPKEDDVQKLWLRKIPRQGLVVTKHTVVCIKHFKDCDIIKHDVFPGKNGEPDIVIPRNRYKLKKGALPCIFPDLPSYLSTANISENRASPSKRRKILHERQENLQQQWLNKDNIHSYNDFCSGIEEHVLSFKNDVYVVKKLRNLLLYSLTIPVLDVCPSLKFCIQINDALELNVWTDNVKINLKDLAWLNLTDGALTNWSQLDNLISHLHTNETDKSSMCSDKTLVEHAANVISQISMGVL